MKSDQFFRELGMIEDQFVKEAEKIEQHFAEKRKRRRYAARVLAAAASLVLCVSVLWSSGLLDGIGNTGADLSGGGNMQSGGAVGDMPGNAGAAQNGTEESQPAVTDGYALVLNEATGALARDIYIPGHFWEELGEEEIKALFPNDVSERLSDCEISGIVHFQSEDGKNASVFNVAFDVVTPSGVEGCVQMAYGEVDMDYVFDFEPEVSDIMGVAVTAGVFEGDWNVYFAKFQLGEIGYYVTMNGDKEAKSAFADLLDKLICAGAADLSIFHPTVPELRDEELTLAEARADEEFGQYVPKKIPDGFTLEGARRFLNQIDDYLFLCWTKGYADLWWDISYPNEDDKSNVLSDEDIPVFRAEELTLDVIRANERWVEDAGDISGPRFQFNVLYDTGVLVRMNCKGLTAEEVYGLFVSS